MQKKIVLSHFQIRPLFEAKESGQTTTSTSLDLGLTVQEVTLQTEQITFPDGLYLDWTALGEIDGNPNSCFIVTGDNQLEKIQHFSSEFNRLYSLMPTGEKESAPTMLISGIPMHRIKGTDPHRDTREKIRAASPLTGSVLDTATGLGYTAIMAAHSAEKVTTIELDPTVLEICRMNPWSHELFENPKIEQRIGDSYDVVEGFPDESFSQIIHDPPMFNMAGHLYSGEFYSELWRILQPRGKLFHYIGNPDSKSGRSVTKSVMKRIQEVGFRRIQRKPRAFGIVAYK